MSPRSVLPGLTLLLLGVAGPGCDQCGSRPSPAPQGVHPSAGGTKGRPAPVEPGPVGPRFEAERVELTLAPGRLEVLGVYTFANPGVRPWSGRIGYPVWVDPGQAAPKQVAREGRAVLPVRCREPRRCASVLRLALPARSRHTLRLRYEQQLTGRRATYLVTTARRWKRPLTRADFVVRVPAAWIGVALSYPGARETREGKHRVLRFSRRDFVPEKELVVTWRGEG